MTSLRMCLTALLLSVPLGPPAPAADEVPASVLQAEQRRIEAIARAKRSAVSVFSRGGRGGGSGVVITPDGYALTNFHVVRPAGDYMQCSMPDGRLYDAVIVSVDPTGDVALIKLLGRDDFPAAELGDSDAVAVGDWCFAVGNPFLLATDFQPTVTYGIVSGVHRYQYPAGTLLEYADCIQTDASINPGNSGGPLYNADGQLIGINGRGSFEKRGRVNVGVGYAISINQIKHFMGYLRSGRIVDHATLGASMTSDESGRVIVSNILESSDAYRRGLRYGDELVSFGGREITTVNGFKNVLGIFPRGWRVPLSFRRDGQRYDVFVRLSGVHSPEELISKVQPARPPARPAQPGEDPEAPEKDNGREKAPEDDNDDGKQEDGKQEDGKQEDGKQEDGKQEDGEQEDGKQEDGEKDDDGERPGPRPAARPAAPPLPPEIAKLIEKRRGYANYYFNRQNRQRVWDAFVSEGSPPSSPVWQLRGSMNDRDVQIELGAKLVTGSFPVGPARVTLDADLSNQLGPDGSGGLLVALHCWQRLLRVGPESFGECYYLGTAPLPGREGQFDVLVGIHDVVECRFFFDPGSGRLAAMELFTDPDNDPCELRFLEHQEFDGHLLPRRISVLYGDQAFGEIELTSYEFEGEEAG